MSDLFTSLAAQALGIAPGIRPLVAPIFAPGSPLANEMPIDLIGKASWSDFNPPSTAKSVPNAGSKTDQHQPSPSLAPQSESPTHPVIQRQVNSANLAATPMNSPATQPPSPHPATIQQKDFHLPNHYLFQHQPFETWATPQGNEVGSTQSGQTIKPALGDLQINQMQRYGIIEDSATPAQVWEQQNNPNELQPSTPANQGNLPARSPISASHLDTHNHVIKSPTVSHQNPTFNPQTSASRNQKTAFSYQAQPLASAVSHQQAAFSPFNPAFKPQTVEPTVTHSPSSGETALPSPLTVQSSPSPIAESQVQSTQSHPESASVSQSLRPPSLRDAPRMASSSAQSTQFAPLQTPQVRLADSPTPIQQNHLYDEVSKAMLTDSVSGEPTNTTAIDQRGKIQTTFIPQSLQDRIPNLEFHPQRESEKRIKPISSHFFRESAIGTVPEQQEMIPLPPSRSLSKADAVKWVHLPYHEGEISATETQKIASVPPEFKAEPETRKNAHISDDSLTSLLPDRPAQRESLTQDARWLQRLTRDRPAAQPPSIRVSIGRIRITASTPTPTTPQFRRPRPSLSLDKYLSQRQEGQ